MLVETALPDSLRTVDGDHPKRCKADMYQTPAGDFIVDFVAVRSLAQEGVDLARSNARRMDDMEKMMEAHFSDLDQTMQAGIDDLVTAVQGLRASGRMVDRLFAWVKPRWAKVAAFIAAVAGVVEIFWQIKG
jgi:hypothetical protein